MAANRLPSLDDITPERRIQTCTFVWDLTAERPIGFKEGPGPAELPRHWSARWMGGPRSEAITERREVEAGWSTYRSNEALLPNLRAQRHREVLFTLYSSVFSSSGSVESSCVAIDWFCVCTADHTSVIFTIIIEFYSCCFSAVVTTRSESSLSPRKRWFALSRAKRCKNLEVILSESKRGASSTTRHTACFKDSRQNE